MALPLSQLPQEIIREVRGRKGLAFLAFVIVSFAVLGAGFVWPYKYQSETIIFVDDRNIIAPLMEGRAVATGGTLLVTKEGEAAAKNSGLGYQIVDLSRSKLYRGYR